MARTLNKLCAHGHNDWGTTVENGKERRYCKTCNNQRVKDFTARHAAKAAKKHLKK